MPSLIKQSTSLQGKAKYDLIIVESGGRVQGELGLNKQNKTQQKKNGKDN